MKFEKLGKPTTRLRNFHFALAAAFTVSLLITSDIFTQSNQKRKDRALVNEFAVTPTYPDQKTVSPMYGTIKVNFVVDGKVTQNNELEETTTTYKVNASWILNYDPSGVTETKTLSGTGNVSTVDKHDPPRRTTRTTTYNLDPDEAVSMNTYGPESAGEFNVIASKQQKCCYFGIHLWDFKVQTHTEGIDYDGQTWTDDRDATWNIQIPSHWQGLAACLASGKDCPTGIAEGSFTNGKTSGSYSAPVFFVDGAGALWEPALRALGEPLDGSGLPYVQGSVTISWNLGG